jgi:hypothetical protein
MKLGFIITAHGRVVSSVVAKKKIEAQTSAGEVLVSVF